MVYHHMGYWKSTKSACSSLSTSARVSALVVPFSQAWRCSVWALNQSGCRGSRKCCGPSTGSNLMA